VTGALVSGQARIAVFLEGSQAWCVQPQSPTPQAVSQGFLPYLFVDSGCASYHPEATLASTAELLDRACREERGLHLALISMDLASSETTRELADDALEDLLEHQHVSEFIENRLFSKPLPEGALWRSKVVAGDYRPNLKLEALKRLVLDAQGAIGSVRAAWDTLPAELFADANDRADFESVLEETGAFRVLAMASGGTTSRHSKGEAQLRLLSDRRYQAFANSRKILVEWTRAIPSAPPMSAEFNCGEPDEAEQERRQNRLPKVAAYEAFQNVNRQKEAILDQLGKRNFQQVERFVDELVRDQLSQERSDLAAKSLCDLAKSAKELGFTGYQLEWSSRAREICPSDPWVHNQFADALLGHGQLAESLEVYASVIRDFPENAVARNGKADVLKALGRLPESLEAYAATACEFPADVVARVGKAEVLKALGRFSESLEVYAATVRDFPESVVARSGKAEVLKAMGRLPEALEAYAATVRDFPENVVAKNGKAEVLKAMGRLQEALDAYAATDCGFPESVVARNGKAEVLKAMGRLPEALDTYAATVRDFQENVVARSGKAEVLKAMGRLPEALDAYDATVRDFPEDVVARNGKAEVLKAMGRLPEALHAYTTTIHDFPEDVVARNGKAEVLKAMGRLPEALDVYAATAHDFPGDVVARDGKAEVLKAMGRLPEALDAYEAAVRDFPNNAVARTGMATLLVLLTRYEEAAALVRTDQTQTRDEWIGLHIRASIKLKQNSFDEADRLLAQGAPCPWADVRSRFIGARAVLRMKRKQLKEADAMIRSEHSLESKVIQIDVYRRMNKLSEAKAVLRELRDCSVAKIVEISRDLERNMGRGKRTVSDEEFSNREIELLLIAA
jgi:tetratricopeptide (TPR) repeat protein